MQPDIRLQKILFEINELSRRAYRISFLIANPFLSKMGIESLIRKYLNGESPTSYGPIRIGFWIIKNYIISIRNLLNLYVAKIFYGNLVKNNWKQHGIALIDCYINPDHKLDPSVALNNYLPNIIDILRNNYKNIVVLPRILDYSKVDNLVKYNSFKINGKNVYFINQSDVLTLADFLNIFILIILQPLRLLGLIKYISKSREGDFIRQGIFESILQNDFNGIIRGVVGIRLGRLLPENITIYQWYENQAIDRAFNAKIRGANNKARIIGLQLFLWPPELLNCFVFPEDFGPHIPDLVLVNGPNFVQHNPFVKIEVGPSLRYDHVALNDIAWNKYGKKLVLLPYYSLQAQEIIAEVCRAYGVDEVIFRFHPASSKLLERFLPTGYRVSQNYFISDLRESSCVIGSASGSLVEALVLGVPVIAIESQKYINYNYLPLIGKGLIWQSVKVNGDLSEEVTKLIFSEADDSLKKRYRTEIRDSYFNFVNKNEILRPFK